MNAHSEPTQTELLQEISGKLDTLLLAIATRGLDADEQLRILREYGLEWKTIGILTGLKAETAKTRHRRASKTKPKRMPSQE